MELRAHLQPDLVHAEDPAPYVSERHILGGERIVNGSNDKLAIEFLRIRPPGTCAGARL
jgi:hypothetical protein